MKRRAEPTYPNLKAWRSAFRLNQRDAARILNISQTTYSRLERGALTVKGPIAKRLMEQTCVPLEVLVGAA